MSEPRSQWSSYSNYIWVTTGAIIGLGNVFQFPFEVTKYGGLFLLFYIICQFLIALPLLFAELMMGRRARQNPVGTFALLSMESGANRRWRILGWFSFLVVFLTMCYYTVMAAYPIGYFADTVNESLRHTDKVQEIVQLDNLAVSNFYYLEGCFLFLLAMVMWVVYRGINRGLEQISRITVPIYMIILMGLAIFMSFESHFSLSVAALFKIHPNIPMLEIFQAALALAFLKYNVGMGTMIIYGSYLPYHVPLARSTLIVVALDLMISLACYFIIFPLVVASNPTNYAVILSTHSVINIFSSFPHGLMIILAFFFAAILAAWTPIISMAEVTVLTLVERFNITRRAATLIIFSLLIILGSMQVASHLEWEQVKLFGNYYYHNFIRDITMNILAPMSALMVAIFAGWILSKNASLDELQFKPFFYKTWVLLVKYLDPLAILLVLFLIS